tara:strand:- start:3473 stop:4018 length:546 start_codon:yes stop_codon:yes gene_type:complete
MAKSNKCDKQPISAVKWESRDILKPNNYNPNRVAPKELELLKISIIENGWTQPIVANMNKEIVDGYHRWTVSADERVSSLTNGLVPVVYLKRMDRVTTQMATIRHNRARGTHLVLNMAEIIKEMVKEKCSIQEIMGRLQMEKDEVIRLANRVGIPQSDLIRDTEWSKSWVPVSKAELEKTS